jgi:hypothetical protein
LSALTDGAIWHTKKKTETMKNENTTESELCINPRLKTILERLGDEFFRFRAHVGSIIVNSTEDPLTAFLTEDDCGAIITSTIVEHLWDRIKPKLKDETGRRESEYNFTCSEEKAEEVNKFKPAIEQFLNDQCSMEITSWEVLPGLIRYKLK